MGAAAGPNISEDGLVLALDAGNVKSNSEISVKWNNVIADATTVSSVGVITCLSIDTANSNFFAQKYSSCLISGNTVWDERPPTASEMDEVLSGNLTCKSHQTGTYNQVQYLFGAYGNAGNVCTLRFTGFGVGAVIGVGGYFSTGSRQCRLTGDLRNSPVTITSPSGGFADPIVLTSDPADIQFSNPGSGGDPWYVYWLGPYNQVPYVVRDNPGYVIGATYSSDDGGALVFDGTDDNCSLGPSSDFTPGTGPFTIEMWIYPTATPSQYEGPAYYTGSGVNNTSLFWAYRSGNLDLINNGDSYTLLSMTYPTLNQWVHLVASRDASGYFAVYENGVVKASTTGNSDNYEQNEIYIGGSGAYKWPGKVSIYKMYKGKGLTAAEVQQNYNATKGRYGL